MTYTEKLWSAAKGMFERMRVAIGDAAALAERAWIGPRERREIRAWLSPIVAMARKIVFIEAAALARGPLPRSPKQKRLAPVSAKRRPQPRTFSLRLWPKPPHKRPRARQIGPPVLVREIWRERAREAAADHLNKVRFMRPSPQLQLARRMEALSRLLARPLAAARRLARKLRLAPHLARKHGASLLPRTRRYDCPEYDESASGAWAAAMSFNTS